MRCRAPRGAAVWPVCGRGSDGRARRAHAARGDRRDAGLGDDAPSDVRIPRRSGRGDCAVQGVRTPSPTTGRAFATIGRDDAAIGRAEAALALRPPPSAYHTLLLAEVISRSRKAEERRRRFRHALGHAIRQERAHRPRPGDVRRVHRAVLRVHDGGQHAVRPEPRAHLPHAGGRGAAHRAGVPAARREGAQARAPSSSSAWWRALSCS